jgi:hypothetical protein
LFSAALLLNVTTAGHETPVDYFDTLSKPQSSRHVSMRQSYNHFSDIIGLSVLVLAPKAKAHDWRKSQWDINNFKELLLAHVLRAFP